MRQVEHRNLSYLYHLIMCGVGFVGLALAVKNELLATVVMKQYQSIPFTSWALSTLKAHQIPKISQITTYMAGVIAMTFYLFTCVLFINNARNSAISVKTRHYRLPTLVLVGLLNLGLCAVALWARNPIIVFGVFLVWVGVLCCAEKIMMVVAVPAKRCFNYMSRSPAPFVLLLLLAGSIFLTALSPYFKLDKLQVANDYLWVPEQTLLSAGKVSNNTFIMNNNIGGLYHEQMTSNVSQGQPVSDSQIAEFISKNKYELSQQILAGHYFHHQSAMLGPTSELSLGKDPSSISYLYGRGNVQLLSFLVKHQWHALTFENYTFVMYSFYILYFCLFAVGSYLLLRDIRYASLVVVTAIGLVLMMGFELIRLAPGYNPLRHLLDMPLLMLFVWYLYSHRYQSCKLALVLGVALLAIYANRESGLMMFLAVSGAAALHVLFSRQSYRDIILLLAGGVAASLVWLSMQSGSPDNMMSLYYLLGVSVAPSGIKVTVFLLLCAAIGNLSLLILYMRRGSQYKPLYIGMFLLFYIECLLVYFAWYTEMTHLLSLAPIYLLFVAYMLHELLTQFATPKQHDLAMIVFGSLVAVSALLAGTFKYFHQMYQYNNIFKTHVVYQWNFPRLHVQSTMNPAVFQEAVGLINQYSQEDDIYLISKYDNILPFLSGKYSALSYSPIMMTLVTDREVENAASEILRASPKYLFVDSDISSDNKGDIVTTSPLKDAIDNASLSAGRVMVLNENKRVFNKVSSQYQLIRSGYLVSIYEHI